jgi:O-antigen/teichoic acid export membrane protein
MRSLLLIALPLAFVAIANNNPGNADTIVVGLLQPLEIAGSYNAALALGRLVALGITSLTFIMLPVASRLHARGDLVELGRSYATITKWLLLMTLPFFLLFFSFPQQSLAFLYGAKTLTCAYAQAPLVLMIVSLGAFIASILGPSVAVLTALGRIGPLVRATVVSAVVDVGGSLLLVPLVGAIGAAVAYAVAMVILPTLCLFEINSRAVVHPFTMELAKPFVSVVGVIGGAFVVLRILQWTPNTLEVPLLFVGIAAAYFLAIPATHSLSYEDGHLLSVGESYLGRKMVALREFGARFIHNGRFQASKSEKPGTEQSPMNK